jgi:hypothetical protein
MRPRADLDADAERARISLARERVMGTVATIRGNYAATRKEAVGLLDESQRPRAHELVMALAEDSGQTLRDKLSAGGGGGRAPGVAGAADRRPRARTA